MGTGPGEGVAECSERAKDARARGRERAGVAGLQDLVLGEHAPLPALAEARIHAHAPLCMRIVAARAHSFVCV